MIDCWSAGWCRCGEMESVSKGMQKFGGMRIMFIVFIMLIDSWPQVSVKTLYILHFKYVQFIMSIIP